MLQRRLFTSTSPYQSSQDDESVKKDADDQPRLTHVTDTGTAHMVSIASKTPTSRTAIAACTVTFSNSTALQLIRTNQMKKGDVLGVARIAGIMAAKRTSDLIPLCHPLMLSRVSVELKMPEEVDGEQKIEVRASVECEGKTGVEMEALTAASVAALTVYDMCKAVDKGMVVGDLRVVLKEGGKSGRWEME
jgi:cyclic pyranopterin phosphate synthase